MLEGAFSDVLARIKNQPTVEERPKGKWKKYCNPIAGEQHYICTHCNEYQNFGSYGDYYVKAFNFCPHCGAEMEKNIKVIDANEITIDDEWMQDDKWDEIYKEGKQ